MKIVKCPCCKLEREVKTNVIISVCYVCREEMVEVKYG